MNRFGIFAAILSFGLSDLPFRDGCQLQFPTSPDAGADASNPAEAGMVDAAIDAAPVEGASSDASAESGAADGGLDGSEPGDAAETDVQGTPGVLTLSTTMLVLEAACGGFPPTAPQSFEITNTGGSPIDWTATSSRPTIFSINLDGSTLNPGQSATVTVSAAPVLTGTGSPTIDGVISITAVGDAQFPSFVSLVEVVNGAVPFGLPANVNFGDVPLFETVTEFIPNPGDTSLMLFSSNPAFVLGGSTPSFISGSGSGWLLSFTPRDLGLQATALQFQSGIGVLCSPSSFEATGKGIPYDGGTDAEP